MAGKGKDITGEELNNKFVARTLEDAACWKGCGIWNSELCQCSDEDQRSDCLWVAKMLILVPSALPQMK